MAEAEDMDEYIRDLLSPCVASIDGVENPDLLVYELVYEALSNVFARPDATNSAIMPALATQTLHDLPLNGAVRRLSEPISVEAGDTLMVINSVVGHYTPQEDGSLILIGTYQLLD